MSNNSAFQIGKTPAVAQPAAPDIALTRRRRLLALITFLAGLSVGVGGMVVARSPSASTPVAEAPRQAEEEILKKVKAIASEAFTKWSEDAGDPVRDKGRVYTAADVSRQHWARFDVFRRLLDLVDD